MNRRHATWTELAAQLTSIGAIETKKIVRDPSYWNAPYGTPITAGMRKAKREATMARNETHTHHTVNMRMEPLDAQYINDIRNDRVWQGQRRGTRHYEQLANAYANLIFGSTVSL